MRPSVFHRICARPIIISWIIGAVILDGAMLLIPANGVRFIDLASDLEGSVVLILALLAGAGMGFFLGMMTCWPWIRPICSRFNGAPFNTGDQVMILAGGLRGTAAEVEDITQGQGGWNIVWLNLGPERRKKFSNIFEEYSLLKIRALTEKT